MIAYLKTHLKQLVVVFAALISIGAWVIFYYFGLTTDYNDAMSHLNIARLVVDNLQPGMS